MPMIGTPPDQVWISERQFTRLQELRDMIQLTYKQWWDNLPPYFEGFKEDLPYPPCTGNTPALKSPDA